MDDFDYPHRIRIRRPAGGEPGAGDTGDVDEGTGDWTPGGGGEPGGWTALYAGPADVQDAGAVVERDAGGLPARTSDGYVYGPEAANLGALRPGDVIDILWNPLDVGYDAAFAWDAPPEAADMDDAQVVKSQRLDGSVAVEFI